MEKTFRLLGLATILVTGLATATMAAGNSSDTSASGGTGGNPNGVGSQSVTGTQLGSQQTNTPATGRAPAATSNQYGQAVGPTGSTQPDATNPVRSNPTGGGTDHGGAASGGGSGGSSGTGR